MSKTFKSIYDKSLVIAKHGSSAFIVAMGTHADDPTVRYIFNRDIAATFMLAIAESAGITPAHSDSWTVGEPDNLARIAADLQHHIERRDARTKEAADQEALYSEARSPFEARHHSPGALEWEDCAQAQWLSVARRARELHGGTK